MSEKIRVESELVVKDPKDMVLKRFPQGKPKEIHIYDTIAIFGQKGSGKTFLAREALIPAIDRKIIYDGEHDFPDEGVSFNGKGKGEFSKWFMFHHPRDLAEHLKKISKDKEVNKPCNIIYRPVDNTSIHEFDFICQMIYAFGNMFLIVDELHNYLPSYMVRIPYNISQVLRLGRHRNIGLVGISQRPADVSPKFKGLASKAFIFKLIFHGDVKYVTDWFGKALLQVKTLKDFKFIYFDGDALYLCDKITVGDEKEVVLDEEPAGKAGKDKKAVRSEDDVEQVTEIVEETEEYYE